MNEESSSSSSSTVHISLILDRETIKFLIGKSKSKQYHQDHKLK